MNPFTSLLTRVLEYAGPRPLPTKPGFESGMDRQMSIPVFSQTRWILADLEGAILSADTGQLRAPARLCKSLRRDGVIHGVLSTRTEGLVQLPIRFKGDTETVTELEQDFHEVFPASELSMLVSDGDLLGVGVAEFVQIPGSLPVLRRLDPEFLRYIWGEDRWYYQSVHGMQPINPGDGRWVLHCPRGAQTPWSQGLWMALGRAYIAKEHAYFYRENYSSKLANAARVAVAPAGSSEGQRLGFFRKVAAWGVNTVFDLPPGWDVRLLESNGVGFQVYQDTIKTCNEEIIITLAGQTVTTDGGAGFANADIHKSIRADLIQSDADALAATLNTQALPVWLNEKFGSGASSVSCAWDVTPPKDLTAEANTMVAAANAVKTLNDALQPYGKQVDDVEIERRFGIPVRDLAQSNAQVFSLSHRRRAA